MPHYRRVTRILCLQGPLSSSGHSLPGGYPKARARQHLKKCGTIDDHRYTKIVLIYCCRSCLQLCFARSRPSVAALWAGDVTSPADQDGKVPRKSHQLHALRIGASLPPSCKLELRDDESKADGVPTELPSSPLSCFGNALEAETDSTTCLSQARRA